MKTKSKTIGVRFDEDFHKLLVTLAKENGLTVSDIVRLSVGNALERYLDKVRYVSPEQGRMIHETIISLGNTLVDIQEQIHRIGVNFNQEIRLRNCRKKLESVTRQERQSLRQGVNAYTKALENRKAIEKEIMEIENETESSLNRDELERLIEKTETAIRLAAEQLSVWG